MEEMRGKAKKKKEEKEKKEGREGKEGTLWISFPRKDFL